MSASTIDRQTRDEAVGTARPRMQWVRRLMFGTLRWTGLYLAALVIFGAFVSTRGVDVAAMYRAMWQETVGNAYGFGQVLDLAGPFILAALAVAVPARAGLVNIGGEGQVVIGLTAAGGMGLLLGTHVTGAAAMALMALAGAGAGAAWAGIAALLKQFGNVSETISTLLLNYVGADVLSYLVYGPWKAASGGGQPVSQPLAQADFLPNLPGMQANVGIVFALAAAALVAWALARTRWGFALRAVGGNPEAARRAGLAVAPLLASALLVGGALAGLGGMVQYSGLEGALRPGLAATFGYTGFLASWLGRHHSGKAVLAATLLAAVAVAGSALQISSNLPGGAVDILTAVILLVVLAKRPSRTKVTT